MNFLKPIIFFLFFSIVLTYYAQTKNFIAQEYLHRVIHGFSALNFFFGVLIWLTFYKNIEFQFLINYNIFIYLSHLSFGLDGLSLLFLLLTLFIFPLCFIAISKHINFPLLRQLLIVQLLLVLSFSTTDLLYFYIFFEGLLIPMFIYIGTKGSRGRKIKAAYYFFLYTLFGSLFMMVGIFYTYFVLGSTHFFVLLNSQLDLSQQLFIWMCFFLAFAVKTPLFPFHLWLPEAHVEAPTIGSIILASLLLKLGGYGFLRFSLTFLQEASLYFAPLVICLATAGVFYGSLSTIRQVDLKRIIAYSSVAHMNLVVLGLFSFNYQAIDGAIYLMLAHGFVSGALFFCIGVLYERHHTRLIRYYGGRALVMPLFASFFLLFTLANMSLPGTANFIGEFLIFLGLFSSNTIALCGALTGIICSAIYSLWLYNRVMFGSFKLLPNDVAIANLFLFFKNFSFSTFVVIDYFDPVEDMFNKEYLELELTFWEYACEAYNLLTNDLIEEELIILLHLAIPTIWLGLSSGVVFEVSYLPVSLIVEKF